MNGILQKWFFPLLLAPFLFFVFLSQADKYLNLQEVKTNSSFQMKAPLTVDHTGGETSHYRAQIFYNKKGLNNKITILHPLREFTAIAKTETETINELIEKVSLGIPKIYYEQFLVNPKCIIILEKKINENHKAEIRFGVAMECIPKMHVPDTINI